MSNPWPKVYRQLLLLWVCVGTSLKHWQNQNDFPILPMTSQRCIYWQSAQARLDLAWHAALWRSFCSTGGGFLWSQSRSLQTLSLVHDYGSVSEITKHVGWAFLLCFSGGTGRKLMRSEDRKSPAQSQYQSGPHPRSIFPYASQLTGSIFSWGETATSSLVLWDQVTLGLGYWQMPEAGERQLGSRKEDGSSASMCEQAEIIPQPWVTPQLWGLLMSSSWWGCTSQWGLRSGTMLAQGQPRALLYLATLHPPLVHGPSIAAHMAHPFPEGRNWGRNSPFLLPTAVYCQRWCFYCKISALD